MVLYLKEAAVKWRFNAINATVLQALVSCYKVLPGYFGEINCFVAFAAQDMFTLSFSLNSSLYNHRYHFLTLTGILMVFTVRSACS